MVMTRAAARAEQMTNEIAERVPFSDRTKSYRRICTRKQRITIGTWNIINGRANRLEMACYKLNRHNVDIALLTETKLAGHHTSSAYGYAVSATKCENNNQGGVAFLHRVSDEWHLEDVKSFGPNVIPATMVHGSARTVIVGVYIPHLRQT